MQVPGTPLSALQASLQLFPRRWPRRLPDVSQMSGSVLAKLSSADRAAGTAPKAKPFLSTGTDP